MRISDWSSDVCSSDLHYSWSKGLKLLGLGRDQLELLPENGMRLDAGALEDVLARCERERQPVLMAVAVLGTTEYGTVDPVDAMVDRSEEHTSELQSLMRISYAVFCLKNKNKKSKT